ncbi:hypothetical protein B296_00026138 [Ensete ventricosum]|uniref:Uncharacterized protein n=1 Tax=Ensete ventricosum TaxID=4639 RepID=A0A426Y4Q1_ENSVE|nr:hypothetical protein B296_00026138 [Ensete ventricosum]
MGKGSMSQERSAPGNPRKDVSPTTQPTSGEALQPLLSLPLFGDGNLPSHTPGQYWRLFNDPGQTSPPLNPRTPVVILEAFQGLTNQVQAITGMLQAIISYIPQLAPGRDNAVTRRATSDDPTCRRSTSVPPRV